MSNEPYVKELLSLAEDAREYLSYLDELGVEGLDVTSEGPPLQQLSETVGSREVAAPTASQLAALERNAAAVERAASTDFLKSPAPSAKVADASSSERDETEMATRKKKFPDEVPPAPQETLFGEVKPQDVESLPRSDETLEDIWNDIGICMRCPLCCQGRTNIVNSEGNRKSRLMFVGEAPGADEDASGRPFVGRAGQLLNKIIEAIGLSREDVFIGNVNRCRPPQNRTPTSQEAAICKPFLLREIAIVRPDVIVVLGNTAMKNLLDTKEGITKLRGKFQDYRGIKVMPTFHPAYLLRDPSKKREAWEDMKTVRDYLKTVASDK
ncbi:MAG TPA: uracil-DNA glycosylase [Pyrinomonadaceae bacterium]|jgi:DNA polymerase